MTFNRPPRRPRLQTGKTTEINHARAAWIAMAPRLTLDPSCPAALAAWDRYYALHRAAGAAAGPLTTLRDALAAR